MIYCLNPNCRDRLNPDDYKFCHSCGSHLLLRNRYRILKPIGSGGFGRTYQAADTDCMSAPCVVKQFLPSSEIQANPKALEKATAMFNQEAVRLFQLGEHPHIPRLLAHFEEGKRLYLVQELIAGLTLRQELATQGAFSEQKIRQLFAELLPILKFIHERGVIHRDIKLENIMRRHRNGKLVLIDFGVSKLVTETTMGKVGTTVGTLGYTPMEQMHGHAYPASDLYSLGVTCVCLLTQSLPKLDGSDGLYEPLECRWMWRERLPDGTTISQELGQILDKLLQPLPKDRYKSASEVLQALNSTLARPPDVSVTTVPMMTSFPAHLRTSGINYSKLRDLLAARNWKEADEETRRLLLQISHREPEGWLRVEDFQKFPCEHLGTIDRLWVKYSDGRFGFSVQKRIWERVGGKPDFDYATWCRFGEQVGWRVKGSWLNYSDLTFSGNSAPAGHLPAGGLEDTGLGRWDLVCSSLVARLAKCKIC
jgi:serine/threonine protein kinase